MTVLAMCCFALVAWTIIVTGQHDPMQGKNVTYIFIDDTKSDEGGDAGAEDIGFD